MAKPKIVKVDAFIRGDTPLFVFPITLNDAPLDLTDWSAYFTLTPNENPSNNTDAVIALEAMEKDVDAGTVSYQLSKTDSETLDPDTKYYGDVQINKDPVETNNFTVVRFVVEVEPDFGIGAS